MRELELALFLFLAVLPAGGSHNVARQPTLLASSTEVRDGSGAGSQRLIEIGRAEPRSTSQIGDQALADHDAPNAEIVMEDPVDARHVAYLLFSCMILSAVLFAMTQTSLGLVAPYTLLAVENIVAVFVAVMMYQALDDITDQILDLSSRTLSACIHAVFWLVVCAFVAWQVRGRGRSLDVCCACGSHFVSFFSLHAALLTQEHYFSSSLALCFGGIVFAIAILTVLSLLGYFVKRSMGVLPGNPSVGISTREIQDTNAEWLENVDDVENHFAGMVCSVMCTMFVRFLILDRYPHFDGIQPGDTALHSASHRIALLCYSAALVILTLCVMPLLSKMIDGERYILRRLAGFFKVLLTLSVAWSFLLWGQWEIYERHFHWSPMFARLVFSGICTVVLISGIFVVALLLSGRSRFVGVHALALITGFAWEENFNHSLDVVLIGHPSKHLWKLAIAFGVALIILPIWAAYLKPLTTNLDKLEGRHDKSSSENA